MEGRVEICNSNVWGTVCDDFFGADDATVACRQLGFSGTSYFIIISSKMLCYILIGGIAIFTGFTNGVGQIWLDNVQCVGTETRLIDCPYLSPIGTHNCAHFEDAGVRCTTTSEHNYVPCHIGRYSRNAPSRGSGKIQNSHKGGGGGGVLFIISPEYG